MSEVTLADIVRLRLQEDVYEQVRLSLSDVARAVQDAGRPDSYRAYAKRIEECAEGCVRPTYEKLRQQHKRATRRALISGYGAGGLISLAINGVSTILSGPGSVAAHGAGNPLGNIAKSTMSKRSARKHRVAELKVGCSLLLSVLPSRSTQHASRRTQGH